MAGQIIKGPWRAVIRRNQHGLQNVAVDMAPLTSWRPSNHKARNGAFPDYEEDAARLIAAAPELLEALEELLAENPVLRSHPIGAENSPARQRQARQIAAADKARAAIAKARGEGQ